MNITSVSMLLVVAAFLCCLASAAGRTPVWISVLLLTVVELLRFLPK